MTAMPKTAPSATAPDFALARYNMVESQLRPNQVTDNRLAAAMGQAPREMFVPSNLVGIAYLDENIPLIPGRFLMQPMVTARLIQALAIRPSDHILDLAPATGYSTLVLAKLAKSVVGVEPNSLLYREAEKNLAVLAEGRAVMLAGAPVEMCAVHALFDAILVNGSVEFLPEILFDQLQDGGRLAAVVRGYGPAHAAHTGQARLYTKHGDDIAWTPLFDANVPPAPGFTVPRGFSF